MANEFTNESATLYATDSDDSLCETERASTLYGSGQALRPLLVSLSALLMAVLLMTYAWHRAARGHVNAYEDATSALILETTVGIIKEITLMHVHAVTVAAKALTYHAALYNSSTDTNLLDRFVVMLTFENLRITQFSNCVLPGWHPECVPCRTNCANRF